MKAYVDTSVIVSALTPEIHSAASRAWLEAQSPGALSISPWVLAEVSSALAMKVRSGQLSLEQKSLTAAYFRAELMPDFRMIDVGSADFAQAASFFDNHSHGLRAGDALHLAIASRHGLAIATIDKGLQDAARVLQIGFIAP